VKRGWDFAEWIGNHLGITLCVCIGLCLLVLSTCAPDAPESAVEAPSAVQAAKVDDAMAERLERVERVLTAVEAYLAEHGE